MNDDNEERKTLTEDVGGEFGFRILWSYLPHWADFKVYEITNRRDGQPLFDRNGWRSLPDPVETVEKAVPYLTGFVKWDGCCEFDYPEGSGAEHFCGPEDIIKHFAILKYLYVRSCELGNFLEKPWPVSGGSSQSDTHPEEK